MPIDVTNEVSHETRSPSLRRRLFPFGVSANPNDNLRAGLREHGQTQLPVSETDGKRRDLRTGLQQRAEFRSREMELAVSSDIAVVRGCGSV